jgi:hypothetical protein
MIDLVFYLIDIDLYECPTEKRLIEGDHAADGLRPFLGLRALKRKRLKSAVDHWVIVAGLERDLHVDKTAVLILFLRISLHWNSCYGYNLLM